MGHTKANSFLSPGFSCGTFHRMEGRDRGRKLVLHRLLVQETRTRHSRPDPRSTGAPAGVTASSNLRQPPPAGQTIEVVELQQVRLHLHRTG